MVLCIVIRVMPEYALDWVPGSGILPGARYLAQLSVMLVFFNSFHVTKNF